MNRPLRHVVPLALSLALLAPLPGVAMADQPRKGEQAHGPQRDNDRQHGQDRASTPRPAKARDPVHLEPQQRESLRRWQDGHPGWQRPVPPDVARGLAVHGHLPPGHYRRPPAGLVDLLPRPPRGHAYFAVGGDVVLAVIATGVIVQIILTGP